MATAEFSKFAGILSAALSQHPGKNLAFICSLSIVESRHCCRYFTKIGLPWSQPCYYSWFSDTEREDQWWPERLKRELREWRAGWDIGIGIYTLLPWRLRGKESACRQAMRVLSLRKEDPLEEEMATCSSILAWKIPRTEEPGGLQSMRSQSVGCNWACMHDIWEIKSDELIRKHFLRRGKLGIYCLYVAIT